MAVVHAFRCNRCDEVFAPVDSSPCSGCGASMWEPVALNTEPDETVAGIHRHHTGVAIFCYVGAEAAGVPVPEWALPAVR